MLFSCLTNSSHLCVTAPEAAFSLTLVRLTKSRPVQAGPGWFRPDQTGPRGTKDTVSCQRWSFYLLYFYILFKTKQKKQKRDDGIIVAVLISRIYLFGLTPFICLPRPPPTKPAPPPPHCFVKWSVSYWSGGTTGARLDMSSDDCFLFLFRRVWRVSSPPILSFYATRSPSFYYRGGKCGREGERKRKKKNKSKKRERLLRGLHCKINALWWNAVRVKGCIIHAVGISVLEPVTKILNIQLGGREKGYFRYRRWMRFLEAAVEITLAAAGEARRQRLQSKVLSVFTLDLPPCSVYTLTNCRIIIQAPLVRMPTIR